MFKKFYHGYLQDQRIDGGRSSLQQHDLKRMVKMKDYDMMRDMGTDKLVKMLSSDIKHGITTVKRELDMHLAADIAKGPDARGSSSADKSACSENEARTWNIRRSVSEAWRPVAPMTWINVFLVVLGLISDFSIRSPDDRTTDWAVSLVVLAMIAVMFFFQVLVSRRMACRIHTLHKKIGGPKIQVVRDGMMQHIHKRDIVVGDILLLQIGMVVPCDGVFLSGHGLVCKESKQQGARLVKKATIERLTDILRCSDHTVNEYSCFIHYGDKVLDGSGRYIVTAVSDVGLIDATHAHTWWISSLKTGVIASALLIMCLIRFASELQLHSTHRTPIEKAGIFLDICTLSVFMGMIVALPQCLPLPMTMQQSARNHLWKDKILLQVPDACEFMASVTDLCLDMTRIITQDRMTVSCGLMGTSTKFTLRHEDGSVRHFVDDALTSEVKRPDGATLSACLDLPLQHLLNDIFALTSCVVQELDPITGQTAFLGSARETALLQFSKELGWPDVHSVRNAARDLQVIPFSNERMASGAFVTVEDGKRRLFLKGASEVLLKKCTRYVVPDANKLKTRRLDSLTKTIIFHQLVSYAEQGLRTLTLCYRDLDSWHVKDLSQEADFEDLASKLIFVGIICFDNPIRDGVLDAIKKIQGAGIAVRLCSGDHPATASSIAKKCGIYTETPGDLQVIEGPALAASVTKRGLSNLRILARSSPENKAYIVSALRELDRIVGFIGDGPNDQLALKAADVSVSMCTTETEVAKQVSHIAILNDDLGSIVKIITWGRCLTDSTGQLHNIHNATSISLVVVTAVSAVASSTMKPALSLAQLLWITVLIIPLTIVLGLSTDRPSESWLENHPYGRLSSYSSHVYHCIAQTVVVLFLLLFKLPGHSSTESVINITDRTRTLIFNTLAFMLMIYCSVNWTVGSLRKVNRKFFFVLVIEIALHLAIVLRGGHAFHVAPMSGLDWGCSIALSAIVVPLAFL